jgi:hypothetical protein
MGPSLHSFNETRRVFDLVIGVNGAAAAYQCDWWSAGDYQTIHGFTPTENINSPVVIGKPNIYTIANSRDWLFDNRKDLCSDGRQILAWTDLIPLYSPPPEFDNHSGPSALVLAKHLGSTAIHTFGVDMTGDKYVDGSTNHRCNEERWAVERHEWAVLVDWLRQFNITVQRGD